MCGHARVCQLNSSATMPNSKAWFTISKEACALWHFTYGLYIEADVGKKNCAKMYYRSDCLSLDLWYDLPSAQAHCSCASWICVCFRRHLWGRNPLHRQPYLQGFPLWCLPQWAFHKHCKSGACAKNIMPMCLLCFDALHVYQLLECDLWWQWLHWLRMQLKSAL